MDSASQSANVTTSENASSLDNPLLQVQGLLQDMQDKFQSMTEQIISRIDDMGHRIDELETNISELMQQSEAADETTQVTDQHMHQQQHQPPQAVNTVESTTPMVAPANTSQ